MFNPSFSMNAFGLHNFRCSANKVFLFTYSLVVLSLFGVNLTLAASQQLSSPGHKVDGFVISYDDTTAIYYTENSGLFAVPATGGSKINLTTDKISWYGITKDSNQVTYISEAYDSLHSVPIGGGEITTLDKITDGRKILSYTKSDDSRYVVYMVVNHDSSMDGELYSVPVSGGQPIHLSAHIPEDHSLSHYEVSDDSKRVIFSTYNKEYLNSYYATESRLYSIPLQGGVPVLLDSYSTQQGEFVRSWFQITEDSNSVVYWRKRLTSLYGETIETVLYTIPIAGGSKTEIDRTSQNEPEIFSTFHLLPEGKIVYGLVNIITHRWGMNYSGDIYSVLLDGGNKTKLNMDTVYDFKIILSEESSSKIFIVDSPNDSYPPLPEDHLYSVDSNGGNNKHLLSFTGIIKKLYMSESLQKLIVYADQHYLNNDNEFIYIPRIISLPLQGGPARFMDSDMQDSITMTDDQSKLLYTKRNFLYSLKLPAGPAMQISSAKEGLVDQFSLLPDSDQVVYTAGKTLYIGPQERAFQPMLPGTMHLLLEENPAL